MNLCRNEVRKIISLLCILSTQFVETLPNAKLQWIEECGHVPHLEKPDETAEAIATFMQNELPQSSSLPPVASVAAVGGLAGAVAVAAGFNFL